LVSQLGCWLGCGSGGGGGGGGSGDGVDDAECPKLCNIESIPEANAKVFVGDANRAVDEVELCAAGGGSSGGVEGSENVVDDDED
jgi:hypothetical protein